jgi:hypothetical protein
MVRIFVIRNSAVCAILIREFSTSWKLNFCIGQSKLIRNKKCVGNRNMSDQAL